MDLITLNSNHQADKLIEGYDSLIWTERFNTIGDFEIQTGDINKFLTLLPEGLPISLRESNQVMVVETHRIVRKKNTGAKLIIKGRSFESILDRRVAVKSMTTGGEWVVNAKIPSDVAHYIIAQICVNGILDAGDIFPSAQVQFPTPADYLTSTGPTRAFTVPRGNLLDAVINLLHTEAKFDASTTPDTPAVVPHGIRAIRPSSSGTAVAIEIYTGTDRTATVYFDATRDLLDDGEYLFSKVGSATDAYILGNGASIKMSKTSTAKTGLDRRVILVDGTQAPGTGTDALKAHGETSLAEARETAMFDGSINQDVSPYAYGVDYNLGDIVKLVGDYGLVENARVTEYIRSEDATGFKSYPTLTTVETP